MKSHESTDALLVQRNVFFEQTKTIIAVSAVVFIILLYVRWPWIIKDFLIQDDLIYIPKAMIGKGAWHLSGIAQWFILNNAAIYLQDIVTIRLSYLILYAIALALFCISLSFLVKLVNEKIIILLLTINATLGPLWASQFFFLNGSHPLLSLSFVLLSISFLIQVLHEEIICKILLKFLLAIFFSGVSLYCSPTATIVPLGILTLLLYPLPEGTIFLKRVLLIVTAVFTVLGKQVHLFLAGQNNNHYTKIDGWTDFSIHNIFTQLIKSAKFAYEANSFTVVVILITFIFCVLWKIIWLRKTKFSVDDKRLFVISVLFYVMSCLYFAPVSILTNVISRYLVAPYFFFILGSGIFILAIVRRNKYVLMVLISLFSFVVILSVFSSKKSSENIFSQTVSIQSRLQGFIHQEEGLWQKDAQVVLVLKQMPPQFTSGFNHWSTWYFRYVTKRQDIIGLIGRSSWLNENPIITKYTDHSPQFWSSVETKSRGKRMVRKKMVGLEEGRPTYIYVEQNNGTFLRQVRFIILEDEVYKIYSADEQGLKLETKNKIGGAESDFLQSICSEVTTWATSPLVFGQADVEIDTLSVMQKSGPTINLDGKTSYTLNIPDNWQELSAEIQLFPSDYKYPDTSVFSTYSEVSPPMPFRWGNIAVYQVGPNTYRVGSMIMVEKNKQIFFKIKAIKNCGYMIEADSGKIVLNFQRNTHNAPLVLGKGFKQRYWRGSAMLHNVNIVDSNNNIISSMWAQPAN